MRKQITERDYKQKPDYTCFSIANKPLPFQNTWSFLSISQSDFSFLVLGLLRLFPHQINHLPSALLGSCSLGGFPHLSFLCDDVPGQMNPMSPRSCAPVQHVCAWTRRGGGNAFLSLEVQACERQGGHTDVSSLRMSEHWGGVRGRCNVFPILPRRPLLWWYQLTEADEEAVSCISQSSVSFLAQRPTF
jgi:hypothetical protein